MTQPDDEGLAGEVRRLTARVERLERELGLWQPERAAAALPAQGVPASITPSPAALLPVLGRALLGLAGAYLLRAITESATVSAQIGVAIGLFYAILWLVAAARTSAARQLEAALHSLTSVLVLSPLLWEATLRFHAVSTWAAGGILLFFTVFGLAVSWRKDLLIVATIATLAGLGTAAALLIATHDALPFTLVFLAIAAAVEASACLEHWLSERWLAATAADLSILLATWLATNERGLPPAYAPIPHGWLLAAQIALLAIYLSSTIVRTLLRGFTFTNFETTQCCLAFLISVGGGLRLAGEDPRLGPAMAVLTLSCALACYVVSFTMLERQAGRGRNFYTYSTFGFLLALVGSRILLVGAIADAVWSLAAIACLWMGGYWRRLTLQVHGGLYLLLALVTSGALAQAARFLLGEETWPGENAIAIAAGALAAGLCYSMAVRFGRERTEWGFQLFRLAAAGTLAWLAAGISAGMFTAAYHAIFGANATNAYCATIRTAIVVGAALLLACTRSHNYLELGRLIYPAMAVGAWRLVTDDLHQDRKAALFLSLLIYGVALIALPRFRKQPLG
ncbi:MAG TPA: hypothetical protein VMH81_20280 [Bryobacteraceae bacterium]|nr:hypothetical protein [Bryobacteraceae bacterium]